MPLGEKMSADLLDESWAGASGLGFDGADHWRSGQARRLSYLARRTTISCAAWFFTIMLAGRMPRQFVFGIDDRAAPDDAAGVQHGVAADIGIVAQQRTEFAQPGVERPAVDDHRNVAGHELDVGNLHAGPQVRPVAEDRVADVVEMGGDGIVEEDGVLHLAGIADDAVVADDHLLADVGVVANLAIAADDGRAFDHDPVLDHRAFADEDALADERDAFAAVVQAGAQMGLQVSLDLLQRVPGIFAAVKDGRVRASG